MGDLCDLQVAFSAATLFVTGLVALAVLVNSEVDALATVARG